MKNTTKFLLILSVFAIALSSCSKEKKITRNITKKGGEWRVVSHTSKYYYNDTYDPDKSYVLAENQGSFTFDDNGEVTQSFYYSVTGSMMTVKGAWTNTEDELTISMEGLYYQYKILAESKKGLRLEAQEVFGPEKTVYSLVLEKI